MGCLLSPLSCVVQGSSLDLGAGILRVVTAWFVSGLGSLIATLTSSLASASDAPVVAHAAGVTGRFVAPLLSALALVAVLGTALYALVRGDGLEVLRRLAVKVPVTMVAAVATPLLVLLVIRLTDALCGSLASGLSFELHRFGTRMATHPVIVTFGSFFAYALVVLGTLMLWLELILRQVALAVLVVALPLVFVSALFAPARRMATRTVELFVAAVLAKFLFMLVVLTGLALLGSSGLNAPAVGAATLVVAGLSPLVVLRLLPVLEFSGLAVADGVRSRLTRGAATAVGLAQSASAFLPATPFVTPPVPEDFGIPLWPGGPEATMPDQDVERPKAPIGAARVQTGRLVLGHDEYGPRAIWHGDA